MHFKSCCIFVVLIFGSPVTTFADIEITHTSRGTVLDQFIDGTFDIVTGIGGAVSISFDRFGTPGQTFERRGVWEFPLSDIPNDLCATSANLALRVSGFVNPPLGDPSVIQTWELYLDAGDDNITLSDADLTNLQSTLQFSGQSALGGVVSFAVDSAFLLDLANAGNSHASFLLRSLTSIPDKTITVGFDSPILSIAVSGDCVVSVDIKPGSDPNSINPRSRGKIPVAILTTSIADSDSLDFDAVQVDATTVTFGPDGASIAHSQTHVKDVDGDGDSDLVLHFKTQETGISCGDTEASLTGETFGGESITGTDWVKTSGCK